MWLAAVREAAEHRKPEARATRSSRAPSSVHSSEAATQRSVPPSRAQAPTRQRSAAAQHPTVRPQLPRKPLSSVASQDEEEEDDDDFVANQL